MALQRPSPSLWKMLTERLFSFVTLSCCVNDMQRTRTTRPSLPMFEPVLADHYISVILARLLRAETRLPISFKHLVLPPHFLALQALSLSALRHLKLNCSPTIQTFNKIQTQGFQTISWKKRSSLAPQLAMARLLVLNLLRFGFGVSASSHGRFAYQETCGST
jgi:hypothetical protein